MERLSFQTYRERKMIIVSFTGGSPHCIVEFQMCFLVFQFDLFLYNNPIQSNLIFLLVWPLIFLLTGVDLSFFSPGRGANCANWPKCINQIFFSWLPCQQQQQQQFVSFWSSSKDPDFAAALLLACDHQMSQTKICVSQKAHLIVEFGPALAKYSHWLW